MHRPRQQLKALLTTVENFESEITSSSANAAFVPAKTLKRLNDLAAQAQEVAAELETLHAQAIVESRLERIAKGNAKASNLTGDEQNVLIHLADSGTELIVESFGAHVCLYDEEVEEVLSDLHRKGMVAVFNYANGEHWALTDQGRPVANALIAACQS